jgi:TolA-binding protein
MFAIMIILFACTPTAEKPIDDNFFVPVDTVIRQKTKPAPIPVEIVPVSTTSDDDKIREALVETLLDQDRRLDNAIRQLDIVSNKGSIDTSMYNKYSIDVVVDKKISNEMLLEMIKQRNQRLEDVIERLKLFTQNRQRDSHRTDSNITYINETPARQQPISLSEANSDYGKAIQLYRKQQYIKAIRAFQLLLKQGVDVTLQDNCHFWTGVCHFNLKRTNRAIGEFLKVLDISGSDKKEGAYFMIGQCYEEMGTKNHAKVMFRKMIREYPQGDLKQVAEIKIALLR